MTTREFYDRAIEWLREEQNLRTDVISGSQLDETGGTARLRGFVARASAAARWAMAGLWVLTLGIVLSMANLPGMTPQTRGTLQSVGSVVMVAGGACFAVAEVVRRRNRTRAVVEVRAAAAGPVTGRAIESLHEEARGGTALLVSEAAVAPEALVVAAARGVTCWELDGNRFREVPGAQKKSA